MAILASKGEQIQVPCRCLVGRSALADLVLKSRRVSNEHASIGWYAGDWVLRDLGSSNGTIVNGRMLGPRERFVLASGSVVQFGGEAETWTVSEIAAPEPCAVRLGPQEYLWGQRDLLVLPNKEQPEASLFVHDGKWVVDDGSNMLSPDCGDVIRLPSGHFRVLLPDDPRATRAFTLAHELALDKVELVFRVGSEGIVLHLLQGSRDLRLPSRACLQTLLALARLRFPERGKSNNDGWIAAGDLAELRSSSQDKINVDIHRIRKMFEEAGVNNAAAIIERDDTKKLRIGVERVREVRS